jgi:hypothetical protein
MAKTVTRMDDDGRVVSHKQTRARSKSEAQLIPWTAGPQNRRQKLARALWG